MFKKKRLCAAITAAFGGLAGALAFGLPAHAQSQATLERVEVTGSLLRRIEGEAALPVINISSEELRAAGVTNAEQAMRVITQAFNDGVSQGASSNNIGGAAYASLRGLGAQRTLVLLNGKRIVANPFSSVAVDLNTLPMAAVERIEVLTDGASSTYGTDAIAGVINFITRREYKGVAVGAEVQLPEQGGGELYTADLRGGIGDLTKDRWNVYGGLNFRKQQAMGATERDFSRTSFIPERGFNNTSGTTFPGNYSQAGAVTGQPATVSNTNPSLPNCLPPTSINTGPGPIGSGTNVCRADTQAFTNSIPEQEQWSGFLRGSYALSPNHTASLEYFYASNQIQTKIAPSPESTGLQMPPTSPFYPGNGITPITNPNLDRTRPITIGWRTTVLGSRGSETTSDTQRVVAALEGVVSDWDYQVAALWSKSNVETAFTNGYPALTALQNGIRGTNGAPFLNPFGEQTPAGQAYMLNNVIQGKYTEGTGTLSSLSGVASTRWGALPGGPIGVGVAAEFRKEEMEYRYDLALATQTTTAGVAGQAALRDGDRDVAAIALEFSFPVMKNLEIGASVRYDDYSDFGSTTNPKISFKYTPVKALLLRGSYNTGFAAPTLTQLYQPNSTTFTGSSYNDPVLCPGGTPNVALGGQASRDCRQQFQQLQGGNTALTPEESTAWTIGFVLQPSPEVSFSLDYWDYEVTNNISTIGDATVMGDPVKYANLIIRCSQADPARKPLIPACNQPGGDPIAYIVNVNQNLGDTVTSGFDFQLNWTPGATPYGRFNLNWRGTYTTKYEFQKEKGGQWFNPVGRYLPQFTDIGGSPGAFPRFKQIINLGWEMNAYSASLLYRHSSGYKDSNAFIPAPYNDNTVGAYGIYDLSFAYRGVKGLVLRAGVLNLLDEDPPFTNQTARFQARAYDDRYHNPLGRTWVLGASYEF